jgi:hypothetical protein
MRLKKLKWEKYKFKIAKWKIKALNKNNNSKLSIFNKKKNCKFVNDEKNLREKQSLFKTYYTFTFTN